MQRQANDKYIHIQYTVCVSEKRNQTMATNQIGLIDVVNLMVIDPNMNQKALRKKKEQVNKHPIFHVYIFFSILPKARVRACG